MNNKKGNTRYLAFAIFCGIFLLASLTFSFLINYLRVLKMEGYFGVIFLLLSIVFAIGLVLSLMFYSERQNISEQLKLENQYTLGNVSDFYNLNAFKTRAYRISRKRKYRNAPRFMISFSSASLNITANTFHNEMITTLNYEISLYLSSLFEKRHFSKKNYVYGFNRGVFLLYLFCYDESEVLKIINTISTNLFKIVEEKNIKVYVQPFFGIRRVDDEENLVGIIEDSFIARNVAESNFETYAFFDPSFKNETSTDDITEIEDALNNEEFIVYYQPKYSLKEKKFISVEVLARWDSPKYGFLNPGMFIEKAENAGLISAIDNYIFEKALIDISEARRKGRRVLPVSVNFSLHEFYSHHFLDMVTTLLNKYQVPPHLVEIEITETTSQANQFLSISIIKKLKELGIRVLMDDFGIGYSGIDNLRKIPFDAIKIDKSFADLIVDDEKTRSIVKLIVDLGHLNDIEVIIEGVDSKEQIDILKRMKIDTIQGFYYAHPMPLKDYDEFLKNNQFERKE